MIKTEAKFRMGQLVAVVLSGRAVTYALVEATGQEVQPIGGEAVAVWVYRLAIPSMAYPGRTNHLWAPEYSLSPCDKDREIIRFDAEEAGGDTLPPREPDTYFPLGVAALRRRRAAECAALR